MAPVVRPAVPADAPSLAALRYQFRSGLASAVESQEAFLARGTAWMGRRLSESGHWRCWVLDQDGAIQGHLWLELIEKVPNPVAEPEYHAYITNLYVLPSARGGAGSRLLEAALAWCRGQGVDCIILWPTPASRSLYARYGFEDAANVMALGRPRPAGARQL